jgi:hypothetical protein
MGAQQHPRRRRTRHLARAAVLSIATLSIASGSGLISGVNALQVGSSARTLQPRQPVLFARHGDHGHDEHADEAEHEHDVPALAAAPGELIPTWPLPGNSNGGGGHHGHGGHQAPAYELDEQQLLHIAGGPLPLSYFEWDFNYGAGADEELLRFTRNISEVDGPKMMGTVNGIWRTLVDEGRSGPEGRQALEVAIKNSIGEDGRVPSRHAGLLVLHVAGSILACFIILPISETGQSHQSSGVNADSLFYLQLWHSKPRTLH